jgi:hypothetical protein
MTFPDSQRGGGRWAFHLAKSSNGHDSNAARIRPAATAAGSSVRKARTLGRHLRARAGAARSPTSRSRSSATADHAGRRAQDSVHGTGREDRRGSRAQLLPDAEDATVPDDIGRFRADLSEASGRSISRFCAVDQLLKRRAQRRADCGVAAMGKRRLRRARACLRVTHGSTRRRSLNSQPICRS